jgi:GDP-4-dehydro-6-deoxy-D-mannose reductase
VGSSEEYGKVDAATPLTEEQVVRPVSPYAVARVSQEMMSRIYVDGYGLDIILTRSFNHLGPGQPENFVISSFARKLWDVKRNLAPPVIQTGDLTIVRDFIDVRDVARAYHTLLMKGRNGQLYNICRGEGHTLGSILSEMADMLGLKVSTTTIPGLIRPNDNPFIVGSHQKITGETGWKPEIPLRQSLKDVLDFWQPSAT